MDETRAPAGRPLFSPSRLEPKTVLTACLVVLLVGVLVYVAWKTPIAIEITFVSALVAVALDRPIERLQRRGWKRGPAIGAIMVAFVAAVTAIAVLVIPALVGQARGLAVLVRNLPSTLSHTWVAQKIDITREVARIKALWSAHAEAIAGRALSFLGGAVQLIGALFAMLVVTIFMLVFGPDAKARLLAEAAPLRRPRYERILHDAYTSLGGYLSGLSIIILCNTAVTSLFLAI